MKKIFIFLVFVALIFSFSACSENISEDSNISSAVIKDTVNTTPLPLPNENTKFSFLSGSGAWRTDLTLNTDGTFTGHYLDSEMGIMGEDFPNGSAYISNFSGNFTDIEKINDYSYKMNLSNVKTEKKPHESWIEDGIKYIASEPYGIEKGTEFILYLPNTPISELSKEFLSWCHYEREQNTKPDSTLSCYGILNVETNYGFFYTE